MFANEYLNLRLIRLKPGDDVSIQREGLSFVFPKGGEGRCTSAAGTLPLFAGDVLALNASLEHKLNTLGGGDLVFWAFSLRLENLFPLFSSDELSLVHNVSDQLKGGRRYPAASEVAQECHRILSGAPAQSNLDHRCQLLRVTAAILSAEFKQAASQRAGFGRIEDHIMQVFEELSPTEIIELSVGDLARRFNCSRRHLNRLFHQCFGFSVAALRMEMRLLKAVSLLRDPDAKIINVAEQCGFNHLGLFNSCFKRRFGTSPGQWRKSLETPNQKPKLLEAPKPQVELRPKSDCQMRSNGLCPWATDDNSLRPGLGNPFQAKGKP